MKRMVQISMRNLQSYTPAAETHRIYAGLLALQIAIQTALVSRHEFWRDEIRPLSIVEECHSLTDVFHALRNEGHPMFWYLLLFAGLKVTGSYRVLPVISVGVASCASYLFLRSAPFTLWQRALFVFGHLPLYEYSVVARNYGCTMLSLLLCAAVYPQRFTRPISFGLTLAFAANTSGYAFPIALASVPALAWEITVTRPGAWRGADGWALLKCAAVVLAGVGFAIVTTYPDKTSIVTGLHHLAFADVLRGLTHFFQAPWRLLGSTLGTRHALVCAAALLLVLVCLFDNGTLVVFFLVSSVGTSLMFDLIYTSNEDRHRGIFLIFTIMMLWIRAALGPSNRRAVSPALLAVVVSVLMFDQVGVGAVAAVNDWRHEMSSCRRLGRFLRSRTDLQDAIVLGEPDYLLEALPYYAGNDIYIPREARFGKRVMYTTASRTEMSLHQLLQAGRSVQAAYPRPVVFALGTGLRLSATPPFERHYSYNKVLSFSREMLAEFFGATSFLVEFNGAPDSDENFSIYKLD